jgi:hypothetical protein
MFFALLLASPAGFLTLSGQTSSMLYAPPRPSHVCPVSVAAQWIGAGATTDIGAPGLNEAEKQQLNQVLAPQLRLKALQQQKSYLEARLAQNPDTATAGSLRQQLSDLDLQIDKQRADADKAVAVLNSMLTRDHRNHISAPAQGLDLSIASRSRPIVAVDILIHGFSSLGQIIPGSQHSIATVDSTSRNSVGAPDLDRNRSYSLPTGVAPTESFHLSRDGSGASIHTSIVAKGMMGISWLEVTRVEFADGSTWQSTSDGQCRLAPSLYVPVDLAAVPAR